MIGLSRKAFSMIELLIVVLIIVVLSGLLMPALSSAKRSSEKSADITDIHQLGLAAELYAQNNEKLALSPLDFRDLPEWRSPLWASHLDPSRLGYRNDVLAFLGKTQAHYLTQIVPFKESYLTFEDLFHQREEQYLSILRDRQGAGWLVDFGDAVNEPGDDPTALFIQPYNRLNFDTSVRFHPGAPHGAGFHYLWLFCDPSDAEKMEDLK